NAFLVIIAPHPPPDFSFGNFGESRRLRHGVNASVQKCDEAGGHVEGDAINLCGKSNATTIPMASAHGVTRGRRECSRDCPTALPASALPLLISSRISPATNAPNYEAAVWCV